MKRMALAFVVAALACAPVRGAFDVPVRVPLPRGFRASALALGRFDADGRLDIAVAGESQQLAVFLSAGRNGFRAARIAAAGAHPDALATGDVDGDGKSDIVVANHESDSVTLLRGDGKGGFVARALPVHSVPHPHTVAMADVDGDRRADVIVDSWGENRLMILLAGDGWRAPGVPVEVGRKPYWNVAVADLDGDGAVDVVTPNEGQGTVSILMGDGHARFTHASGSPFAAGPGPFSVAIGDVNGDRRPDVAVANYSGHASQTANDGLTWIRNDGKRRFTPLPARIAPGRYSARLATGDIDKDGYADVVFTNTASNDVTIVHGSRNGPRGTTNLTTMSAPHSVALGDLNGDGRADLVVASEDAGELLVFFAR